MLSSDRPPREIATLEERLRSRFEWGLITDIQPPDLETRIAILRKKVKTDGIHVADPQVLTFIAGRISTNIRELEGALTRVVAFSSLTGRPMTVDLAQDVLKDVFPQGEVAQVTIERIQEIVCERFALSLEELCSHKRSQNIVYPRQVAMYLSRELTDSSLPKIGKQFGGRDHTTVIHANSKITAPDPRGPHCVQPRAGADRAHQAGAVILWSSQRASPDLWKRAGSPQPGPTRANRLSTRILAVFPASTLPTTTTRFSLKNE